MPVDVLASEPHYVDHLAPVWRALPLELRGQVYIVGGRFSLAGDVLEHARRRGLDPQLGTPTPSGPILVAGYSDLVTARASGRRAIALLEHGIGQSYGGSPGAKTEPSYAGGRDHADVGLFLVPNAHAAARWLATYPSARVAIVGSPKVESVKTRSEYASVLHPVIALGWHWNCRLLPETRSAFYEYRDAIAPLTRRFTILGHGHPRLFAERNADLAGFYGKLGIEVVRDFEDVLKRADLYVCDNSSTLYEFAATGRPVVVVNSGRYRRKVEHGLRFWEAATVGLNCNQPRYLAGTIEDALEDPPHVAAAREAALDIVYGVRSGGARLAAEAIAEWIGAGIVEPASVTM